MGSHYISKELRNSQIFKDIPVTYLMKKGIVKQSVDKEIELYGEESHYSYQ